MNGLRPIQILGLVAVIAFLLASFTPLPNILNRWAGVPSQLQAAEAIVVLAAGMDTHGVLSHRSLQRTIHGIVLFQRGFAPLLAFSGPVEGASGRGEAEVRAEMARLFGVSTSALVTETTALTTREEAARMAGLLQPLGVSSILLVTSYDHMARSRLLFEKVGFRVQPAPVDELSEAQQPEARLHLMRQLAQEFLARAYYRLAGYL
ncbi:MAG TPA: YdcF family protein [Candidatus Tectomicrobia bacterium]